MTSTFIPLADVERILAEYVSTLERSPILTDLRSLPAVDVAIDGAGVDVEAAAQVLADVLIEFRGPSTLDDDDREVARLIVDAALRNAKVIVVPT